MRPTQLADQMTADRVREILAGEGVVQEPPSPSALGWFQEIASWFMDWFGALFGWSVETSAAVSQVLAAIAVLGGLVLVGTIMFVAWRGRRRRATPAMELSAQEPPIVERQPTSTIEWRRRLQEKLAAGERREALEALWWWLFSTLGVDRESGLTWTARRLVRIANRPDLLPWMKRLESGTYGPRPLDLAGIARSVSEIESRVSDGGEPEAIL